MALRRCFAQPTQPETPNILAAFWGKKFSRSCTVLHMVLSGPLELCDRRGPNYAAGFTKLCGKKSKKMWQNAAHFVIVLTYFVIFYTG